MKVEVISDSYCILILENLYRQKEKKTWIPLMDILDRTICSSNLGRRSQQERWCPFKTVTGRVCLCTRVSLSPVEWTLTFSWKKWKLTCNELCFCTIHVPIKQIQQQQIYCYCNNFWHCQWLSQWLSFECKENLLDILLIWILNTHKNKI